MTTTAMKITADWPRKRELPLVHNLYSLARPRNSAGEIDAWPDELLASTEEQLRQICMTNTMIFRTDDGGPRKIHAACTYAISTYQVPGVGGAMKVVVSRWAACPDASPGGQKQLAVAMFGAMEAKINTGDVVVTVVSEYDLWRQILLRFCGFRFVKCLDLSQLGGPQGSLYRFAKEKR